MGGPGGGPGGMRGGMGGPGGPGGSKPSFKRTFSSLSQVTYRYFWIGMVFQMGAMQMQMMARGFLTYELTGSASLLGVVSAGAAIPALIFGLSGGVLADRFEKKRIIQLGQVISLFNALFIGLSITTGTVTWQHLLVASLVQGGVMPLVMPARQAIIPQIIPRERMMNAIALNSLGMNTTTFIAPSLAGLLVGVIGIEGIYYVMAVMYIVSVIFTGLLPTTGAIGRGLTVASFVTDLSAGFRYVRDHPVIFQLLILAMVTMVLAMPIRFILPLFAKDVYNVGADGLGFMMSAMGVGGFGGALLIASLGQVKRRGLILASTGLVSGSFLLVFAAVSQFVPIFIGALVALALVGLVQSSRMTLNNSLMMEHTDEEYRGRVMGLFTLGFSLMPAGILPVTILAESIGAPAALSIMAGLLILIASVILITSRQLRQLT